MQINSFLEAFTTSKEEIICIFPFIGKKSLQLRIRLVNSIENNENNLKFCKLKSYFPITIKLNSLFRYKDSLKKNIRSDTVYRYTYSNCKVTYYDKTYPHFLIQLQRTSVYLI